MVYARDDDDDNDGDDDDEGHILAADEPCVLAVVEMEAFMAV